MYRFSLFLITAVVLLSCANNTKEDNSLDKYFKENRVTGTFALFDNGTGDFTLYNLPRYRDSAYLPASTFDVVSSLVGLETGRAKDSAFVINNVRMIDAFAGSTTPWFQELTRRIGKDTMQYWLDTLGYGRLHDRYVIKNNLDTFWLDNSLKISGDEQLGLVKKLYFGQLPFQPRSQRMVKNMMKREENSNYLLSYKTGTGKLENGHLLGWNIGWIEENRHPYFYILQLESDDANYQMDAHREKMLKDILKQYGFMEGKR
jgi:beta-lactamase class D